MSTLKQKHEAQKLSILNERIRRVDAQLLHENKTAQLLIEALDDEDLQRVSKVIDKLRSLKGKGLEHLDSAIEQAESELNKYTAGGPIAKAWSKMKSAVGIDNPIVKIMTFASALESGFKQIPTILKNNVGQLTKDMSEKTLNDIVTDENKKQTLVNNMLKALSPKGIFGAFKKVPYTDTKQLVADLMSVKLQNLNAVVKQTTTGAQSSEIANDMKDSITGKGDAETKQTQPGSESQPSSQTTSTSPSKSSTTSTQTTPTGQKPFRSANSSSLAKTVYDDIKADFDDVDERTVMNVLNTLAVNGKLKS